MSSDDMAERKRAPKSSSFSPTEVGVLIESLRDELRVVADGVADVHKEVNGLKAWRAGVTEELALNSVWRNDAKDTLDAMREELRAIKVDRKTFDGRLKIVEAKVGL